MDNGYNCTRRPCYQYFNLDAGWDRKFYLTPGDLCTGTFGGSVLAVEEGACLVQWPGGSAQRWHYSLFTNWWPVVELEGDATAVAAEGPPLPLVAKIRRVDELLPQIPLKVELKSPTGTVSVVQGATGSDGQMRFFYLPAGRPVREHLVGSCDLCANPPATKDVEVFGGSTCSRDAGSLLGNPIHLPTAEKVHTALDWADPGPHPLNLVRHYRSGGVSGSSDAREYWGHNYNARLLRSTASERILLLGDGTGILLRKNRITQAWENHTGKDTLIESADGPSVVRSDDSRWRFDEDTGRLLSMTARNGWTTTLTYDAERLVRVTNAFGKSLQFAYQDDRLAVVATPDGRMIRYVFQGAKLHSVVTPDGATQSYLYENLGFPAALTGIVDERGQRYATYAYDQDGRAISTSHAGGAQSYAIGYGDTTARKHGSLVAGSSLTVPSGWAQVTNGLGIATGYLFQSGAGASRVGYAASAANGGHAASRAFTSWNLPAMETDFLGSVSTFSWDLNRQLLLSSTKAANKPEAQTTSTQWHPTFRLPVLVTEAGRTTATTYDAAGNPLTETVTDTVHSTATTRSWTYTAQGLVATETAANGTLTYAYDPNGNRTSVTDALGRVTRYAYDTAGRLTQETTPGGTATLYTYDARGRLLTHTAGTQTTVYSYTPTGQLATLTLPSGQQTSYSYDAAQRLIGTADNRGFSTSTTLDALGNRTLEQIRDSQNTLLWQVARSINALNKVGSETVGANQGTSFGYDANGERITETNGLSQSTGYTLDGLRRITAVTNAASATATLAYNGLDAVTTATDFKGVATSYSRDALGNARSESSPDIGSKTTQYDAVGRPSQVTDALGQATTIERDAVGRITQLNFADGKSTSFGYDASGIDAPKEIVDRSGSTSYRRDALGRVTTKTQVLANGTKLATAYSYNAQGLLEKIWYPGGGLLKHSYDATGLLTTLHWNEAPLVTDITWTPLGQPKSWNWVLDSPLAASRSYDLAGRMTQTEFSSYTYDAAGRITSLTQQLYKPTPAPQPATVVSLALVKETRINRTVYQYVYRVTVQNGPDAQTGVIATLATVGAGTTVVDGRVKVGTLAANASVTPTDTVTLRHNRSVPFDPAALSWRVTGHAADAVVQASVTWSVGYDAVGRIVSFGDGTNSASFTYDANGNRLTSTQTKNGETISRSYSVEANRLLGFSQSTATSSGTAETTVAYTHNANGDLLSDGLRTYGYDAEGRLASATTGQSDDSPTTRYAHNALGQRVFKTEPLYPAVQGDENEPGFLTSLMAFFKRLWSPQTQGAEKLGWAFGYDEDGTLLAELGSGGASSTGSTKHIWLPTSTGPMPMAAIINGAKFAVHADHLNTPRRLTNRQGNVAWQWGYSAFGDTKPTIAANKFANTETTSAGTTNIPAVVYNLR